MNAVFYATKNIGESVVFAGHIVTAEPSTGTLMVQLDRKYNNIPAGDDNVFEYMFGTCDELEALDRKVFETFDPVTKKVPEGHEVTYTNAPTNYDGFGTITLARVKSARMMKGAECIIRKVATPAEHVVWQRMRYCSGLNFAMDASAWLESSDAFLQ